jgi:hypothetical protein
LGKRGGGIMTSNKYLVVCLFLCSQSSLMAVVFGGHSFLTHRSQGNNSARTFAGSPWRSVLDARDIESGEYIPWSLLATLEYTQSFRGSKIAQYFFGSQSLTFSGSRAASRGTDDILADYFGLPADFKSVVSFCPRVRNIVADLFVHFNFDHWIEGLYASLQLPIVHTKWNMNLQERIDAAGSSAIFHPAGYLSNSRLTPDIGVKNVATFFQGNSTFGDMRDPLSYGCICGEQQLTGVAELRGILGYNVLNKTDGKLGIEFHVAAPTGSRAQGTYLFEPMIGNGKHWEIGAALRGFLRMWEDQYADSYWALAGHLSVIHLCKARQKRSFDFMVNGPGSRYMLIEELGLPVNNLNVPSGTAAPNQYQSRLFTAINKTTLDAQISIPAQVDFVLKAEYHSGGFGAEIGYNLWFSMAEKLVCRQLFDEGKYAIKGDAMVYGFDLLEDQDEADVEIPTALNTSQSKATLHAGQGATNLVVGDEFENFNVDAINIAFDKGNNILQNLTEADSQAIYSRAAQQARSSNPPIILKDTDLNNCSALSPKAISHKLFAHLGYAWEDCKVAPYVGAGAEVEIACICFNSNSALSQWGLWIKAGISY